MFKGSSERQCNVNLVGWDQTVTMSSIFSWTRSKYMQRLNNSDIFFCLTASKMIEFQLSGFTSPLNYNLMKYIGCCRCMWHSGLHIWAMAVLKTVMQSDHSGHTCNAGLLQTLPSMESAETHVNVCKKYLLKLSDLSDNWNNLMKFWDFLSSKH